MGVSVNIVGIMEPDEDYRNKVAAWHACAIAGVPVPEALAKFFDWETPRPEGREIHFGYEAKILSGRVEAGDGATFRVADIPAGVTKIRVYMS